MPATERKVLIGSLIVAVGLIATALVGWRLLADKITLSGGAIESSHQTSFSTSSSTSAYTAFAPRRLAVMLTDAHPVLDAAHATLRDGLTALPYVDAVDVYPPGRRPEPGARLHDAYLTLGIDVAHDRTTAGTREFKATVHLFVGSMPYVSHSSYFDHLTPPSLRFEIDGKVEHASTSAGDKSTDQAIAAEISKELVKQVTDKFNEWHGLHAVDFTWPDALIGDYPDDLDIPWPAGLELEPLVDGYGLMRHRHAMWTTRTNKPKAIVQAFHQACTDAGWRITPGAVLEDDPKFIQRYHLRARNGYPIEIEVFEVRQRSGKRETGEVSRICVRYQHRFDRPEIGAAFDQLLDNDQLDIARLLTHSLNEGRANRFYQAVAETHPTDPQLLLELARYYHRDGRVEKAEQTLAAAYANRHRARDVAKMADALKKAGEEMGFDELVDPPITAEALTKLGYQTVEQLAGVSRTVGLNEPVLIVRELNGKTHAVDLYLAPNPDQPGEVQLHMHERHGDHATLHSRHGTHRDNDGRVYAIELLHDDRGMLKVRFWQQADHPDRYDVELSLSRNAPSRAEAQRKPGPLE